MELSVNSWESMVDIRAARPAAITKLAMASPEMDIISIGRMRSACLPGICCFTDFQYYQWVEQHEARDGSLAFGGKKAREQLRKHGIAKKPQHQKAEPDKRRVLAEASGPGEQFRCDGENLLISGNQSPVMTDHQKQRYGQHDKHDQSLK